jgi:hypothetical protein
MYLILIANKTNKKNKYSLYGPERTAQKTSLQLLRVLQSLENNVHRAVPQQRLLYCFLFKRLLLGNESTCHKFLQKIAILCMVTMRFECVSRLCVCQRSNVFGYYLCMAVAIISTYQVLYGIRLDHRKMLTFGVKSFNFSTKCHYYLLNFSPLIHFRY